MHSPTDTDIKDVETNALLALATSEQRRSLLNLASGKSRSGRTFEVLMYVFVLLLFAVPFMTGGRDAAGIALTAGLAIVLAYMALSVQVQQRFQALIRLLELEDRLPH